MEKLWYRQYFWLLVFGGIILFIAIISFAMVCFCRTQMSRSLTLQVQSISKQQKKQTEDHNVAVVTECYCPTAPPPIILPEKQEHQYDIKAERVCTSECMYSTVKKNLITRQQPGINFQHNGRKNDVDLQLPNHNDRYSCASYDSVGHITDIDYINADVENHTKDLEYIEVIAEEDGDDYDDVEII